jgi:hypothetical protein
MRFWLGMAQMAGATLAGIFLVTTGVSALTLVAVVLATGLTTLSRALYRRQHRERVAK